jgi:hypothetical protein
MATAMAPLMGAIQGLIKPPPAVQAQEDAKKAEAAKQNQRVTTGPMSPDDPSHAPGSFASKLGSAVDELTAGLGDAAHATDTKGGGWLSGIANTLNARAQRLAQQKRDGILNARNTAENIMIHRNMWKQDKETRDAFAKENRDRIAAHPDRPPMAEDITHEDLMKRTQSYGQSKFGGIAPDGKPLTGPAAFAFDYDARITGETPVMKDGKIQTDKDGNPIVASRFTVVPNYALDASGHVVEDNVPVTKELAEDLKKYGLPFKYTEGAKITSQQETQALNMASAAKKMVLRLDNARGEHGKLTPDEISALMPKMIDPSTGEINPHIMDGLMADPLNPLAGLKEQEGNADYQLQELQGQAAVASKQTGPAAQMNYDKIQSQITDLTNRKKEVTDFIQSAFTREAVTAYESENKKKALGLDEVFQKPELMEGHTSAYEAAAKDVISNPAATPKDRATANRVLEMAHNTRLLEVELEGAKELEKGKVKQKLEGGTPNPNGLTGDEFLNILPPGRAALLRSVIGGKQSVNAQALLRTDKGQALLEDLNQASPGFDATKSEGWLKAWNTYMTASNPTTIGIQNFNTALQHVQDVYNTSGGAGFVPGTDMYRDRQAAMAIVTGELAKAVKNGVATEGEAEAIKEGLSGWTANSRRERAVHTAGLLKEKIDEIQHKFDEASPSPSLIVPKLMSPEAEQSWNFLQSGGERTPQQLNQQARDARAKKNAAGTVAPKDAARPNDPKLAPDGKTSIWLMKDGTVQDSKGNKYNKDTGQLEK